MLLHVSQEIRLTHHHHKKTCQKILYVKFSNSNLGITIFLENSRKKMVKIEFFDGWAPWPRFERKPQTNWMRPAPTQMIEWCLCDPAAATASWASVDLDGFLERTASGAWFLRDSRRAGGKGQPARCSRKTQDKFAIVSMAKKLLHRCIGAHARVHVHFLRGAWQKSLPKNGVRLKFPSEVAQCL